jgi:C4-dicarboxylate-specific signal transduction histidine kinase
MDTNPDLQQMVVHRLDIVLELGNAQTYQELAELNTGLEQKVTERTQELAHTNSQLGQTNSQLQQSVEQLEQAYQELEHRQGQLVRAEKMAAFGRLMAGVAHEINTPLSASMTSLTLIKKLTEEYQASIRDPEVTEDDHDEIAGEMQQHLSDTHQWLDKAAGYIRSLKLHSRSVQRGEEGNFSLQQVLEDTTRLLSHDLRLSECQVRLEGVTPQLMLHGDPGKLGQVFTNLITNAIDAYKETEAGKGDIHITLEDDGDRVQIRVSDQAGGISPEHCERIFDEFFSTKLQGKGTGLGLAICRSIVNSLFDGSLEVESQFGHGTTFVLQLPRQRQRSVEEAESLLALYEQADSAA